MDAEAQSQTLVTVLMQDLMLLQSERAPSPYLGKPSRKSKPRDTAEILSDSLADSPESQV